MSRLTTNKPVDEMSMLELAYNSCYAKDRKAMYEDYETVRDARDFARSLYKAYLNEELPTDYEEFDGRMMDDLQYESEVHLRGLIALFYRNLWAMADLRERLKNYEDKEEQGLLIELPCKVGDTVYQIGKGWYQVGTDICEFVVTAITISKDKIIISVENENQMGFPVSIDCIGKRLYLTRSEAEEEPARMKGE